MASIVEDYMDGSDNNDDVFPCKGCGEILEEGKAFELAGNRWHLDCFRCNTCNTLLDSDANLLLLGDGSLICNNCTYSCTACGNKIEDLAILTGDQAFCSTCFRCRNCKRKIDNLRYARTSQGIFCMGCHETLMARRRKKSKAAAAAKAREKEQQSPMVKEKSLPALPPNVIPNNAFSNDKVDPDSDTPTELSPRPRQHQSITESSSRGSSRPARSPERSESISKPEGLGLPPQAYRGNNGTSHVQSNEVVSNDSPDSFFISVGLDPSPGPSSNPRPGTEGRDDPNKRRDYFSPPKTYSSSDNKRSESHSATPHIAFQDKGRTHSDHDIRLPASRLAKSSHQDLSKASSTPPDGRIPKTTSSRTLPTSEDTRWQDTTFPKQRSSSTQSSTSPDVVTAKPSNGIAPRRDGPALPDLRRPSDIVAPPRTSQDARRRDDEHRESMDSISRLPPRAEVPKAIARKELPQSASATAAVPKASFSSGTIPTSPEETATSSRQTSARPSVSEQLNGSVTYMQPRHAPMPPPQQATSFQDGTDEHSPPQASPKLPRWSGGADFSLDEDMARILGTDEGTSHLLRRSSNAARHGRAGSVGSPNPQRASHARSVSETTRATTSPRWQRVSGPEEGGIDRQSAIGSPASLRSTDDVFTLRRQLRNSEQRVAELEKQFDTEKDLQSLTKRLTEKRKTVSVLDSQTEMLIQQLEVLTKYVERAKETKTAVDPRNLEESAIKEFVMKLENVRQEMAGGIERLHEEREQLMNEHDKAVADRDRALMEFEQLSMKNAQLADMNNDLTQQLQERYKHMGGDIKSPNGLGIYTQNKASSSSADLSSMHTGATLIGDEEPILESGPTVVQVRKGQVKKFNWKKGSKTMAQNISKGMNKAVVAFQNERDRPQHQPLAGDGIGMPYNATVVAVDSPVTPNNMQNMQNRQPMDPSRPGFGFFGKKGPMTKSTSANTMVADIPEPSSVLFGSELAARADFERRQIPSIVTRCIEEVELRGMDQEGIYRKTGGNSQVTMIKEGLDKDENFDLSDPDLDITAVTSVLKQYFRKLPTPLLSYDIYERVLESTAVPDEKERCEHLRATFATLPQAHRNCLEFLMFHLDRVAHREPENLMSPKNLAVVFAPTIMRDLSIEREMTDMHSKNQAVQFVIEHTHTIFIED